MCWVLVPAFPEDFLECAKAEAHDGTDRPVPGNSRALRASVVRVLLPGLSASPEVAGEAQKTVARHATGDVHLGQRNCCLPGALLFVDLGYGQEIITITFFVF